MQFINAKVVTFEHFFQGKKELVVPHDTPDETIKKALDSAFGYDNWQQSSYASTTERMKQRVFDKLHTPLKQDERGSMGHRPRH